MGMKLSRPPRRCVDGMYDALESLFVIVGTSRFQEVVGAVRYYCPEDRSKT